MSYDWSKYGTKSVRELLADAEGRGWTVTRRSSKNHLILHHTDGDTTAVQADLRVGNRGYANQAAVIRSKPRVIVINNLPAGKGTVMLEHSAPPVTPASPVPVLPEVTVVPYMACVGGGYKYPSDYVDLVINDRTGESRLQCRKCGWGKDGKTSTQIGVHSASHHGTDRRGRDDRSTWVVDDETRKRASRLRAERAQRKAEPKPFTEGSIVFDETFSTNELFQVVSGPVPMPGTLEAALDGVRRCVADLQRQRDEAVAEVERLRADWDAARSLFSE